MHRFQKLTLASLILLGGIASSLAAPRIHQDQYGVSYMQDSAGTWYAHGAGDAWHRVQGAPAFIAPNRSMPPRFDGRQFYDTAKGDVVN